MPTGNEKTSKKASAANTINAKTMLHFMLIRDEIGMLPRPKLNSLETGSAVVRATKKSKQKKSGQHLRKIANKPLIKCKLLWIY